MRQNTKRRSPVGLCVGLTKQTFPVLIPNMMHDVFKKYLGTQEPPHSLLPETLRPSFGKGRNWMKQEMVGPYASACVCVCVSVCLSTRLPTITLFSLGFCLCKVSILQSPFSLNLWAPFNITTLNSCPVFSLNCQGTLSGPSCLFILSPNPCHHVV